MVANCDMDDQYDIVRCHGSLVRQINNVLCFFGKLDSITKFRLLMSYCFSLYGSVLWNVCNHRLNASSSPVLTATCLSYGSFCDFLTFFPEHAWGSDEIGRASCRERV